MFLGFVLAATTIQTRQKATTAVALLVPAIALGLPIMDTLLAIGRRAARGRPLFQADKEHIHHRLMAAGLSHRQAVLVLYGFCLFLGSVALILTYASMGASALLLLVLAVVTFICLRALGYMRFNRGSAVTDRKRNRAMLAAVRPLGKKVRQLRSPEEMWPVVMEAASSVGAVRVRLRVEAVGVGDSLTFAHGFPDSDDTAHAFRFVVPGGKSFERLLELGWSDERQEIDRDTEIAVEIFCEYLGESLDSARPVAPAARTAREARS
jgi:UDP-GlcNAc:undecaprenyl-phosphate GlcNAc-1-phosphate transferase